MSSWVFLFPPHPEACQLAALHPAIPQRFDFNREIREGVDFFHGGIDRLLVQLRKPRQPAIWFDTEQLPKLVHRKNLLS